MKKLIVLLTLLFVIANTQYGTLVTHYDLEGNLLSEEIMAPIEDEITYYDSNELSIEQTNDLETQDDSNQISIQKDQKSESHDFTISTENTLQPIESNQQQNNLIGSSFEIQPVVNQQPKIETSIDQKHYQEQELDRQQYLQEDHIHQNIDNIQQKIPEPMLSQEQDMQEQNVISTQKEEMQLQPVVVSQNQVIDIQQDVDQNINSSDTNTSNEQNISDQQQQQQNQENQLNLKQSEQNQANVNTKPIQNKIIQDMPIQEQIIVQSGNEIHALPDSLNSIQENQEKQQVKDNQENMPLQQQIKNQSNNEVLEDSLNSLQGKQEKQYEYINIQASNTNDQIEVTQNFGRIIQDMIPESDEDTLIQDPQEEQGKQQSTQTSQIEEDIKFNNEDEQQNNIQQVTQQRVVNDQKENEGYIIQENKKIEQDKHIDVQEITLESFQAKREIPEEQSKQSVNTQEKNVKENEVARKINNPFEDDGLKLSSEVTQDKCIIIYSQCEYQGFALEACDSLKDIEKFKHKIKSIYIPQGYGLTIFQNQNFNGQSHRYTSSQRCLEREVSFIQLQMDQIIVLKHQNLRGQN